MSVWTRKSRAAAGSTPTPKQKVVQALNPPKAKVPPRPRAKPNGYTYKSVKTTQVQVRVPKIQVDKALVSVFHPRKRWEILCEMARATIESFHSDDAPVACSHPEDARLRMYFGEMDYTGCLLCGTVNPSDGDPEMDRIRRLSPEERVKDLAALSAEVADH